MENVVRYIVGAAGGVASLFAPIKGLIICAMLFVAIDFLTGVVASRRRAKLSGEPWGFESSKAWKTVVKLAFVMGGIVLAWLLDSHILHFMNLKLANLFTGFVCGVEFWSYLENAAEISDHPLFRKLKKYMKVKLESAVGESIECGEEKGSENE